MHSLVVILSAPLQVKGPGKGKFAAFKLLCEIPGYQEAFCRLGQDYAVPETLFTELEAFTCSIYGSKAIKDVNELRYAIFCTKKGDIESHQLPPCQDSLRNHIRRSNYQSLIWNRCPLPHQRIAALEQHGWEYDGEVVSVKWMNGPPAPDAVLAFLSCDCKKKCVQEKCCCMQNGLRCTDLCRLKDCENAKSSEDESLPNEVEDDDFFDDI